MILKYVLKNFRRRKVRTVLMVLSLMVSTGLVVAMSVTVETIRRSSVNVIATATGRYDLTVQRTETSPDPFINVADTRQRVLAADERITAVYPRFLGEVELSSGGIESTGLMLALDPAEGIGQIETISGTYQLGDMRAAVLQGTAFELGRARVGDSIEVAYSFPQPREKGAVAPAGSSRRRAVGRFVISAIVRQNGVADAAFSRGVLVHLDDAQSFLGLPDQAEELIALVDPALYEAGNAEQAALSVRDVAVHVQAALDDTYGYQLGKAQALDESGQMFLIVQALISTYGLMSLGIVGLLVYTLVMTNVQEQRREMAIMRILGSQRGLLFAIVLAEVAVIGLVGVGLGILVGQAITTWGVVPLIRYLLSQEGQATTIEPVVSLQAILPALVSALVVLFLSALKPAREAARTKVVHAINPGVADNIQLEDLDTLRERRPTAKLFVIGLAMILVVLVAGGLIFSIGFQQPAAMAALALIVLLFTIAGLVLMFYILTRPLEKLVLLVTGLISPRLSYFARRNVARGTERNTLISLLVLFSGVLPSFLATDSALGYANVETDVRLNMGAPVEIQSAARWDSSERGAGWRLRPSFVHNQVRAIAGIDQAVGMTWEYDAEVTDVVAMRRGALALVGVTGNLNDVLFDDLMIWTAGGPESWARLLADPSAVVISQGLAEGLAVPLGGTLHVRGEGLDHVEALTVVGIAQTVPGFPGVGRVRTAALNGGTVFISLEGHRRVTTDPRKALPGADDPVLDRVLATLTEGAEPSDVDTALHDAFGRDQNIWTRLAEVQLLTARADRVPQQVLLLVLTLLSFATAVFGVFAVIYVNIYARRREIGMMKALGARNWELNGILSVESITMTLSAALAGILAGSTAAYALMFALSLADQRPQQFAVDVTVMPFVVIMGTLASILGSVLSSRRIVKRRAVEILRMS